MTSLTIMPTHSISFQYAHIYGHTYLNAYYHGHTYLNADIHGHVVQFDRSAVLVEVPIHDFFPILLNARHQTPKFKIQGYFSTLAPPEKKDMVVLDFKSSTLKNRV